MGLFVAAANSQRCLGYPQEKSSISVSIGSSGFPFRVKGLSLKKLHYSERCVALRIEIVTRAVVSSRIEHAAHVDARCCCLAGRRPPSCMSGRGPAALCQCRTLPVVPSAGGGGGARGALRVVTH